MKTKLNLRRKSDSKIQIGAKLYTSDRDALYNKAVANNLKVSEVIRSLINDYIDGNIIIEQ